MFPKLRSPVRYDMPLSQFSMNMFIELRRGISQKFPLAFPIKQFLLRLVVLGDSLWDAVYKNSGGCIYSIFADNVQLLQGLVSQERTR